MHFRVISLLQLLLGLQPLLHATSAITVDPTSHGAPPFDVVNCLDSLAAASLTTIYGMLQYYGGDQKGNTPGVFNSIQDYYWWMAGAAWNAIMQYWWLTGDDQFNDIVMEAMLYSFFIHC
jgi:hypothetical protein